ncbi:hypothetical protein LPB90_18440 [Chryseobacterium sp. LC2016-29]|uniref:hypothetical protein n=1 Tax=Chryseobacterium sp. LC2016-29 TaxID=2897331 RepID=UPI001E2D814A|nr:hypothetical protein [Chryseobacterium sp. LC2016-29]MCD0480422.1 hypothetical protein [Chryseobacterium sp. LC2016-29]
MSNKKISISDLGKKVDNPHLINIVSIHKSRLELAIKYIDSDIEISKLEEAKNCIKEIIDVTISTKLLIILLYSDAFLVPMISEFGLDTATKDELMSAIALFLKMQPVPTYGDNYSDLQVKEYYKLMKQKLETLNKEVN